jgi:Flp pilus assembly protein TadD
LEQYERAIRDYSKAIELDPDYVNAHNNRGFAYQALGKTVEADFKKYEELTGQKP